MNVETALLLALLALAVTSFVREWLPLEVTALALVVVLLLLGLIDFEQVAQGFSNRAVLAIAALFVLGHALGKTGLLEGAAERLTRFGGGRPAAAIAVLLAASGLFSAFLNNTAVVAIFLPLAMRLCERLRISPSRVLLPLSYAAILGGTLTLIGTSTNLLVSSVAAEHGQPPFGMFEFSAFGAVCFVAGLAYLIVFAPRLLPDRAGAADLTAKYRLGSYLGEARIAAGSRLVGRTLEAARIGERYGATVVEIDRDGERLVEGIGALRLQEGDLLIVQAAAEDLLRLARDQRLDLVPGATVDERELSRGGMVVVEVLVGRSSAAVGRRLDELDLGQICGGLVLAVRRWSATIRRRIAEIRLHPSDSLLVLLPAGRLADLAASGELLTLSTSRSGTRHHPLAWLPLLLLPAVVAVTAAGLADIATAAFAAVVLLLVSGVLTPHEAYRAVDWPVIFLIAAFVPVGGALVSTGAAAWIASQLLSVTAWFPPEAAPWVGLAALYLATSLLTEVISNAAAAILLSPIAVSLAGTLDADPRPFLVAVCFAASASFMTPIGYQTNMMVYGPGGYRFADYVRFGAALDAGFWLLAALLIPRFWPF